MHCKCYSNIVIYQYQETKQLYLIRSGEQIFETEVMAEHTIENEVSIQSEPVNSN